MHNFDLFTNTAVMLTIFLRTLIVFTTVFIIVRLMGKRQIGEMQPFELVITLVIADLACIPMADVSTPMIYGIVSILCIFLLHKIITKLNKQSPKSRTVLSGKPAIVITPDGIDYNELDKLDMSVADLSEAVRNAGYFYLDEVEYAIFETNGQLSVLEKEDKPKDDKPLPVSVITEGMLVEDGVTNLGITVNFVENILKERGIDRFEKVIYMSLDEEGKAYLQEKDKKYATFTVEMPKAQNEQN